MIQTTAPVRDLFAGMNKLERARAIELEAGTRAGTIAAWWYEGWTFKLGPDARYTPDFVVQYPDGHIEAEEVKGFWRDDAKVKCRVFVARFPIKLVALTRVSAGSWDIEEFLP